MSKEKSNTFYRIGLFLLLFGCGWVALGPIQWGNITVTELFKIFYKIAMPVIFFIITLLLHRSERLHEYWDVFSSYFLGAFGFFIAWLVFYLLPIQATTVEGIALVKLFEAILIIGPIIMLLLISKTSLKSIYIAKGNLKLGLIFGLAGFGLFVIFSFTGAELLFYGTALDWNKVLIWLPWIFIFIFANSIMEELLYRGLFIRKYGQFFSKGKSNLLQAIIFALIHFGVTYTSQQFLFLILNFFLGLLWGYMVQKTDSLIGSTLFHAGADFVVIIGIFSVL
jgi:membrane protease YdiL (CAAX protease family)